jgi:hypothetical protein
MYALRPRGSAYHFAGVSLIAPTGPFHAEAQKRRAE